MHCRCNNNSLQVPHVPVRMGLHIGDIIFNDEDIFGDGVNLASRIESLGVAGSILISDKANEELHNHPSLKTVSVGVYQFKNVKRAVEVFALNHEGLVKPAPNSLTGKTREKYSGPGADNKPDNLNRTFYRDQLNKTANAIEQSIDALAAQDKAVTEPAIPKVPTKESSPPSGIKWLGSEILRRNVLRAAFTYIVVALLLHQGLIFLTPFLKLEERLVNMATIILLIGFPFATLFAWFYEVSPHGFIRTTSADAATNPFPSHKKKPFTGTPLVSILILTLISQYIYFIYLKPPVAVPLVDQAGNKIISIAVLPFENRGGDNRDQYIADGITDDIINRLTIISKFRVTNRGQDTSNTREICCRWMTSPKVWK